MDFVNQALEMVKNLLGFLGEFEASGIVAIVQKYLGGIDLSAITAFLSSILAIFGQAA
ncbi:MAG: hypothetical protein IK097_02010 [Clostridia bacterium]|nr:hypothetical protein [Clostridia bacterium]